MKKDKKLSPIVIHGKISSLLPSLMTFLFTAELFILKVFAADLDNNPSLDQINGIIGRIFNTLVYASGGVLVALIAYGVIKASLATGDPRGLEGAQQTWTYAVYGFFVIVLFFSIFIIVAKIFGITSITSPSSVLGNIFGALNDLLDVPDSPY